MKDIGIDRDRRLETKFEGRFFVLAGIFEYSKENHPKTIIPAGMPEYQTPKTQKLREELEQLTNVQAILKAVADARIDQVGIKPEEIYKLVLDRINKSEFVID